MYIRINHLDGTCRNIQFREYFKPNYHEGILNTSMERRTVVHWR